MDRASSSFLCTRGEARCESRSEHRPRSNETLDGSLAEELTCNLSNTRQLYVTRSRRVSPLWRGVRK